VIAVSTGRSGGSRRFFHARRSFRRLEGVGSFFPAWQGMMPILAKKFQQAMMVVRFDGMTPPDLVGFYDAARRVLKPGGVLPAAVVSRYASMLDGLTNWKPS